MHNRLLLIAAGKPTDQVGPTTFSVAGPFVSIELDGANGWKVTGWVIDASAPAVVVGVAVTCIK